jgi:hypothetical protein
MKFLGHLNHLLMPVNAKFLFRNVNCNSLAQAWAKWDIWSKFATDLWSQALEI